MKRLFLSLLLLVAIPAMAQHHHHRPYPHHGHGGARGWGWIAPAIIGGAIVYGATRSAPPPVVYQQPVLPPAPYGYHYEQILDANCNCYRWVLVQG